MSASLFRVLSITLAFLGSVSAAHAQTSILFVGNSYTFGRNDWNDWNGTSFNHQQVLTYNAGNVRDLTAPRGDGVLQAVSPTLTPTYTGALFTNVFGTNSYPVGMNIPGTATLGNSYSPHTQTNTWGGVAGIFKQFTVQAGLNYDVALSTRNAASLRGHLLNTANTYSWDLRGNISSQKWDKLVLQEQSDEALLPKTVDGIPLGSNLPSVRTNVDLIEDWVHKGKVTIAPGAAEVTSYKERDLYTAQYGSVAACEAAGGGSFCNNGTTRNLGVNANASLATQIYLQQTWARPDLINAPGTKTLNRDTAIASYDTTKPVPSYFGSLEDMTAEMVTGVSSVADYADDDGTSGIAGIIPTGKSFLRAVQEGVATRNMYAGDALTDGLIDLWFNDGTHPSKWGSYLSALTAFHSVTGLDPRSLGRNEIAARDLGISQDDAQTLQRIAYITAVPEPETSAMLLAGLGLVGAVARRRKAKQTAWAFRTSQATTGASPPLRLAFGILVFASRFDHCKAGIRERRLSAPT